MKCGPHFRLSSVIIKNGAVFASMKVERWASGAKWHPVACSTQDQQCRDCDAKWSWHIESAVGRVSDPCVSLSVLHTQIVRGHLDVGLVILARPDFSLVNVKDKGCTALHHAAADGFHDVVNAILNRQDFAEVNAVNNFGWTALQFAASNGHYLVCQLLVQHPATGLESPVHQPHHSAEPNEPNQAQSIGASPTCSQGPPAQPPDNVRRTLGSPGRPPRRANICARRHASGLEDGLIQGRTQLLAWPPCRRIRSRPTRGLNG